MKAAVLASPQPISQRPLRIAEVADPELEPGYVLLKVHACGVCRTDLHIVEGDLPPQRPSIIPGHQIVGEVVAGDTKPPLLPQRTRQKWGTRAKSPLKPQRERLEWGTHAEPGWGTAEIHEGMRVGVSWLGGTDGTCPYCRRGEENLCDSPIFTGYSVPGGYAEYAIARADFVSPLPPELDDLHAAPLLCAGIIGFRSLRVAGVQPGERVGLFGFGASAHLAIAVLQAWKCEVYVSSRGESHRKFAASLGATWVGTETEKPPTELDRAVTFAPSGDVVIAALSSLRKGGVVAINAIHLDRIPQFDYDKLLWGERQIRSVANMTRADARDFLALAAEIGLKPKVTVFSLDQANEALLAVKNDAMDGAAVIVPR
jgi:alcohol dehydrogenase, propanol-preferring